jgi:hypothetical protein
MQEVNRQRGRVTLIGLADLVRGLGGGLFATAGEHRQTQSVGERGRVDLESVCDGKVTLSREVRAFPMSYTFHPALNMLSDLANGNIVVGFGDQWLSAGGLPCYRLCVELLP